MMDDILNTLAERIEDLSLDYDRMSESGKKTYEEICSLLAELLQ